MKMGSDSDGLATEAHEGVVDQEHSDAALPDKEQGKSPENDGVETTSLHDQDKPPEASDVNDQEAVPEKELANEELTRPAPGMDKSEAVSAKQVTFGEPPLPTPATNQTDSGPQEISTSRELFSSDLAVYQAALQRLDVKLARIPCIGLAAEKLHVPPTVVALVSTISAIAFCLYGFGGQLLSTFLGFMLPAYESFKCVESFSNLADPSELYSKASSMQFWLIYWIVVAAFSGFEYMFLFVLKWIPFYFPLKLAFLLWLYMSSTKGANHVYHWIVAPTLRRNRHHIDAALEQSHHHIRRSLSHAASGALEASVDIGMGSASQLSSTVCGAVPVLGGKLLKRVRALTGESQD